jgi:hypothetical protein
MLGDRRFRFISHRGDTMRSIGLGMLAFFLLYTAPAAAQSAPPVEYHSRFELQATVAAAATLPSRLQDIRGTFPKSYACRDFPISAEWSGELYDSEWTIVDSTRNAGNHTGDSSDDSTLGRPPCRSHRWALPQVQVPHQPRRQVQLGLLWGMCCERQPVRRSDRTRRQWLSSLCRL